MRPKPAGSSARLIRWHFWLVLIGMSIYVVGLSVFGAIALLGHSVPSYWLMIVAAVTVAVSTAHLGVRAFTS